MADALVCWLRLPGRQREVEAYPASGRLPAATDWVATRNTSPRGTRFGRWMMPRLQLARFSLVLA